MSNLAAFYSLQLSDNVIRAKAARAQKGLALGDIPFGYCSKGPKEPPDIVPDEARVFVRSLEQYAAGDSSMLDMADALNRAGFEPRSKSGRAAFSKATIAGILSNPFYAGDTSYHGEVIGKGLHQPIVTRELWDKVQQVRRERARRPQIYAARPKRPYLLSGVGFCAACGSPLWANTTGDGRNSYYRCASRSRGELCPNCKASCRTEFPESEVSSLFSRLELPAAWRDRVPALVLEVADEVDVERERRRLEEKIRRVRRGLVDGVLDNATAKAATQEAKAALAGLKPVDGEHRRAGDALTDIRELWPHMTAEERRDLVRLVLARVDVDLETGAVGGVIPKPAFAPLFRVLAEEEGGLISICGWRPRWGSGCPGANEIRYVLRSA